ACGGAHHLDHLEKLLHFLAAPDQVAHAVELLELPAQIRILFSQAAILERGNDDQFQLFDEILGLDDVVVGAHLEGLNRGFSGGKCGEQNELACKSLSANCAQQIDTRHLRHFDVRDDQVVLGGSGELEGGLGVGRGGNIEALFFQENLQQFADGSFVVNDKNVCPHHMRS